MALASGVAEYRHARYVLRIWVASRVEGDSHGRDVAIDHATQYRDIQQTERLFLLLACALLLRIELGLLLRRLFLPNLLLALAPLQPLPLVLGAALGLAQKATLSPIPPRKELCKVNLSSAVYGALAAGTLSLGVGSWSGSPWAGVAAGGAFAFSPLVWEYSVQCEVSYEITRDRPR